MSPRLRSQIAKEILNEALPHHLALKHSPRSFGARFAKWQANSRSSRGAVFSAGRVTIPVQRITQFPTVEMGYMERRNYLEMSLGFRD
jgi:hypothetical protein